MWSFFSRDPAKDFSFEIGEKINGLEDKSIWTLHEGKRKSNGEPVSVFCFDVKGSSETQQQLAKTSFKKIKTLRHPNILTFLDGLESEKVIYVATESVVPLEVYLQQNLEQHQSIELAISWGLHQIAKGLSFLVNDCNFIHNNVCMASIFVDKAGEWKLGGMDYMYPATGQESIAPVKILPCLEKYDPPERAGPGRKPTEKWSADSWGLGCLIWEIFNGTLPRTSSLKALGKIPKHLVPHYCELVGANPRSRPNPAAFVQNCRSKGGFMDNKLVDSMFFLEEIQIKDQSEKNNFFNGLAAVLDSFPQTFCRYKILPQLIHAFEYGNAGSAVLVPLFKLGKCLDNVEYQEKIVPCIVKLFSSTDRATRVHLLQQTEMFVEHLSPSIVNEKIFPNLIHGFNDTNPVVREQTIKSMMHLAPKLNYKNLNEELLKHFARLQSKDTEGGIRTNTTVCLGKIAGYLNPEMRQKVLSSAYLRALKDPFPPARQAAILAMGATNNFFTLRESAGRLLPALCSMSMDSEKIVRDQAFKAIKCYLGKLEKFSENPESIEELEKDVKSGGSQSASAAGWTGWAVTGVSSLTSKFYKGKGQKATPPQKPPSSAATTATVPTKADNDPITQSQPSMSTATDDSKDSKHTPDVSVEQKTEALPQQGSQWDNGWDDEDWGDMNDESSVKEKESSVEKEGDKSEDGWDEDDWGSLENTTKQTTTSFGAMKLSSDVKEKSPSPWGESDFMATEDPDFAATSSYNWDQPKSQSDFFSSVLQEEPKVKKTSKQPQKNSTSTKPSSSLKAQTTAVAKSSKTTTTSKAVTGSKTSDSDSWGGDSGWSEMDTGNTDSGWNDGNGWGDGGWGSQESSGMSKADMMRKKREEKKQQRQKEIEEKRAAKQSSGALKLGTKKLTKD